MLKTKLIPLVLLPILLASAALQAKSDKSATRMEDLIWANGKIYDTIVTGASFKNAPQHSLDIFFNFGMSGLGGQRPISDAAPGDKEYNGGRWWVHVVTFTPAGIAANDLVGGADGIIDMELTSADDVLDQEEMGYLTITPTEMYFSCPLVGKGK